MHDYMLQEMVRQRIEDLHREASVHRMARLARGRKTASSKWPKPRRALLREITAPK